jgi:raffinose/stachyose/melibiose transport system permease protein
MQVPSQYFCLLSHLLLSESFGTFRQKAIVIGSKTMQSFVAGKRLRALFYIVTVIVLFVQLYPILWIFMSSFKTKEDFAFLEPYMLPSGFYWGNYYTVLFHSPMLRYFLNSIIVATGCLAGLVFLSAPAAFSIAKLKFSANEKVMNFFLIGIMIPIFSSLIPLFRIYNSIGLRNTYLSLILPQIGFNLPLSIYLYAGYMKFVPESLLEAATIDGATSFQVFSHIMFPICINSTVTVLIYNFVGIWNEFTFANTFMTKSQMKTLPIGLNDFIGEMGRRDWGATFAAIMIAVLPTIIIYFVLNKRIISGMVAGAVKE